MQNNSHGVTDSLLGFAARSHIFRLFDDRLGQCSAVDLSVGIIRHGIKHYE